MPMDVRPERPERPVTRPHRALLALGLTGALLAGCGTVPDTGPTSGASTSASTSAPTTGGSSATSPGSAGPSASGGASASATASGTPGGSNASGCRAVAAKMTRAERIGQLFMVFADSRQFSSDGTAFVRSAHIGSVILIGPSTNGVAATRRLTDRIRQGAGSTDGVGVLLAADQEGGLVQRLKGPGFDEIPSAVTQGQWSDATLRSRSERWAGQLADAGIAADLAPVADVVPTSIGTANQPIGQLRRQYGSDPDRVADKVTAFVQGMRAGEVATSVKHFPGLGRVRGNTDFQADVTDTVTTRNDVDLAGFAAGIKAGADMVMISSAVYRKIDADQPATFSSTVITDMLRGDLGFDGVVISDDLAGKALTGTASARRAEKFIAAGGDLSIMTQNSAVPAMITAISDRAADDADFDADVTAAATRVLIMKARYGLADCA